MAHLSEIVDSLEYRIGKLLVEYKKQQQINLKLEDDMATFKTQVSKSKEENDRLSQECTSLKLANSLLGSDQHKRETKLKINALVREIDLCINQLSE